LINAGYILTDSPNVAIHAFQQLKLIIGTVKVDGEQTSFKEAFELIEARLPEPIIPRQFAAAPQTADGKQSISAPPFVLTHKAGNGAGGATYTCKPRRSSPSFSRI